jgi:hypothetical protein
MQEHRVDQHIHGGMELGTDMLPCDHECDAPCRGCHVPKPRKEPMLCSQLKRSLPFIIYSFLVISFWSANLQASSASVISSRATRIMNIFRPSFHTHFFA